MMRLAGRTFQMTEVVECLQFPEVHPSISAFVLEDGTVLNAWSQYHDGAQPLERCEELWYQTEQLIAEWKEKHDGTERSAGDSE